LGLFQIYICEISEKKLGDLDGHLGYPIYEKTEIFVYNNWRNIPAKAKSALEWSHVFRAIPISNTSPYYGMN
jgi:hypothetical protein